METRECIKSRRSVRKFTDQAVSDEQLHELLEAVRWSPSWANTQCWEVVVIKEQANKEKLSQLLAENNPATKGILQAPVVFVLCAQKGRAGVKKGEMQTDKGDWFMFDVGIASQNLCLAAHDMGLGTVHVGSINHRVIDQLLELPDNICSVEVIPLGYPAQEPKSPPRKELETFVHAEKFGQAFKIK